MKHAWIVVREEKHLDIKFWVCEHREDALRIATDLVNYWKDQYSVASDDVDETCYTGLIFNFNADGMFRVYVQPQVILGPGEDNPDLDLGG